MDLDHNAFNDGGEPVGNFLEQDPNASPDQDNVYPLGNIGDDFGSLFPQIFCQDQAFDNNVNTPAPVSPWTADTEMMTPGNDTVPVAAARPVPPVPPPFSIGNQINQLVLADQFNLPDSMFSPAPLNQPDIPSSKNDNSVDIRQNDNSSIQSLCSPSLSSGTDTTCSGKALNTPIIKKRNAKTTKEKRVENSSRTRRKCYRPRKPNYAVYTPPGTSELWKSENSPFRAVRDPLIVSAEGLLGERLCKKARDEADVLFERLLKSACDIAEKNKIDERNRLQKEEDNGIDGINARRASCIEAQLSRHKKNVYIAALLQHIKQLSEDLCVLKSAVPSLVKELEQCGDKDSANQTVTI